MIYGVRCVRVEILLLFRPNALYHSYSYGYVRHVAAVTKNNLL
jgi:hypothetical protein